MEFTNEELDIIGWGIKQLIKDKQYCVDDEEKGKLMDLCKKVNFKKKINNLIDCETTRVEIEIEDRKRENERKERERREELEELKEEVKRKERERREELEEEEEEVIQKPVKTYGKGKKYNKSYTEITKNPNKKTIRSYFKELNDNEIEEVEKSFKKKGKCVEIKKNVCFYDKRYYIIFKFNNNSSIQKEVESNVWLDDFNMSWDRYEVNHNINNVFFN
tara:strand:- start:56 stop:712 length:657 start_codon:yes stop_codon:yes gene_type:complete